LDLVLSLLVAPRIKELPVAMEHLVLIWEGVVHKIMPLGIKVKQVRLRLITVLALVQQRLLVPAEFHLE